MQPMSLKNFSSGLPERGHIKIGMKAAKRESSGGKSFQPPQKLDHFIITTMTRGADGNFTLDDALMGSISAMVKEPVTRLTRIPIRLLYDDLALNFATRYAAYERPGKPFCSGNGVAANELRPDGKYAERLCPCDRVGQGFTASAGNPKCKPNGILTCEIDGAESIGGVWKFRTTSWNTIRAILGQLFHYQTLTGGPLAGLPLVMTVGPKQVTVGDKQQTIYMVGVEFPGTADGLREAGYKVALRRVTANIKMETVEATARKLLALPDAMVGFPGEDQDSLEEFYPDARAGVAAPVDKAAWLRQAVESSLQGDGPSYLTDQDVPPPPGGYIKEQGREPQGGAPGTAEPSQGSEVPSQEPAQGSATPSDPSVTSDPSAPSTLASEAQVKELEALLTQAYGPDAAKHGLRFCKKYGIESVYDAYAYQVQDAIEKVRAALAKRGGNGG